MALEESGIDLVVDGLNAFEQGLEAASGAVEGLGSIAESVSAVGLEALGAAMDAVMSIASGGLTLALDLAAQGVTFLKDALIGGIAGAMDGEVAMSRLSGALNRLGDDAPITADQASKLASEFQTLAGGSDDAVLSIIELGVRSQQISETEFPQFIQQALDLGEVLGNDEAAARLLTRAQEDAASILPQLRRANIIFTESEEDKIKALVAAGQNAEALEIINAKLAETTGGAAAQANLTAAGAWNLFTTSLGEAAETVGTALLPLITTVTGLLNDQVLPVINTLAASLANDLSAGVTAASGAIGGFVGFIQANLPAIQESFTTAWNSIMVATQLVASVWRTDLQPALAELFTAIFGQAPSSKELLDALLGAIVTGAQNAATWVATVLVPAVKQFSNWVTEEFQPRAVELRDWLQTNLPIAIQTLSDFWTTILQPALSFVWGFVVNTVIPMLTTLATWLQTNVPIAIQAASDFLNNTLIPAFNNLWAYINTNVVPVLTLLWAYINDNVIPILSSLVSIGIDLVRIGFETLVLVYNTQVKPFIEGLIGLISLHLQPAITTLTPILDAFADITLTKISGAFADIQVKVDNLIAVLGALVDMLNNIHIPTDFEQHSPSLFEKSLMASSKAVDALIGNMDRLAAQDVDMGLGLNVSRNTNREQAMSIPELLVGRMVVSDLVMGALPVSSLGTNVNRSIGIAEQNNITLAPTYNTMRGDPPSLDDLGQLALAMT